MSNNEGQKVMYTLIQEVMAHTGVNRISPQNARHAPKDFLGLGLL